MAETPVAVGDRFPVADCRGYLSKRHEFLSTGSFASTFRPRPPINGHRKLLTVARLRSTVSRRVRPNMPPTQDAAEQRLAAEPQALATGGEVTLPGPGGTGTRIDPAHILDSVVPGAVNRRRSAATDKTALDGAADPEAGRGGLADGPAQVGTQAAQLAALLDERQRELDEREMQLDRREAGFAQEVGHARLRLSQRRRQIDQRQAARRRVLQRQSERLDRRRAALLEVRRQAAEMRRQALEVQAATEQLHAQLAGSAPQDALSATLDRLRRRLADHDRDEVRELTRQRAELELLKAELADQYELLRRRLDGQT